MILVHVKLELPGFPLSDAYSKVLEFVGSPLAAPTFMILLGTGIAYSKNKEPKKMAKHGLMLILIHYTLNFAAFSLPSLTQLIITGEQGYRDDIWHYLFGVDILAFAGLTFLFFAVKEKLRLGTVHLVLIAMALSCANYIITWLINSYWLWPSTGLFVRVGDNSFFPFLSWIGYPVMGYVFGSYLLRCLDKKTFYKYLLAFSLLTALAISLGSFKYVFDLWGMHFGPEDYYYQDFIQYILVGGICFSWISLMYFLCGFKLLGFLNMHLSRWSRNVTVMYVAQWIIIGWISVTDIIDFPVDPLINLASGLAVVALSDACAMLYKKLKPVLLK